MKYQKLNLKKGDSMSEWITANLEWVLLWFMVLEKVIKLSPTKHDDMLLDMILKPLMEKLRPKK